LTEDLNAANLAGQVLSESPHGSKLEWGERFLELARFHAMPHIREFISQRTVAALGSYVAGIKAAEEKKRQNERILSRGISHTGRLITPTISIRGGDGSRQQGLWVEASPFQFIEAVLREQNVIDGRAASNAMRMKVVEMLQSDPGLMDLATLGEVCRELGVDPDTLGLDELETGP